MSGVRHQRLAGAHPVAVALQRVDLAVVREVPVRVRERPRRERVGGEAAVHQRQRRLDPLVGEVGEELGQLRRGEHALVDEGAARQRREVDRRSSAVDAGDAASSCSQRLRTTKSLRSSSMPVAPCGVVDEELPEARHHAQRGGADHRRVDRAPRASRRRAGLRPPRWRRSAPSVFSAASASSGRNARPTPYAPAGGQREVDDGAQEAVGDLEQDAGAVAGVDLGARRAAVVEVAERAEGVGDDRAAGHALDVADERDPAGVVLEARVVEPERLGDALCGTRAASDCWGFVISHPRTRVLRENRWTQRDDVGPAAERSD